MTEPYRYKAFISYAHADKKTAAWLFRRIETFRTPRALIGAGGEWGQIGERLTPVFRDREELSTTHALGEKLIEALKSSEFLIVLCSPNSARSRWVNEEIKAFRAAHGPERVLAIISEGDPGASVGEGLEGCFPPALLAPAVEGGKPEEPIAADLRGDGDGDRLAFLKLAAGLLGVGLDDLVHREARRRQKFLAGITALASTLAFVFAGIALFAIEQRNEAQRQRVIAVDERDTATSALDYLVGIFEIANPATENPKTITALTILDRGLQEIDKTFADKPQVQAKLLGAMGRIYADLGEIATAKKTLEAAIARPSASLEDLLNAELRLADLLTKSMDLDGARAILDRLEARLTTAGRARNAAGLDFELYRGRLAERRADIALFGAKDDVAIELFAQAKGHFARSKSQDARLFIARAASTRGMTLARAKRFPEAREELESAKSIQLDLHGPEHLETAIATHNLAYMYFEAGELDKAAQAMAEAVRVYRKVLEPTHPTSSTASLLQGRILEAKGDYAGAVAALRDAVSSAALVNGRAHQRVGFRLLYLALAQAKSTDFTGALRSLDEAQVIYDASFPVGDFNHGDIMVYRGMVLGRAGRLGEARKLCTDGLAILAANLKADDAYLAEMNGHCAKFGG
ncbi:MAG: toll/interleukin-1 receptor domain-containing protein [Parvularculaceae bacterium]